jgi:hypothetical protein
MRRLAVLLAVLGLGACGGGGDDPRPRAATPPAASSSPDGGERPAPRADGPVTRAEEAAIRGWSDALRGGDVEAASRYFGLPASVSNGTPPVQLRTMAAVRFFNGSLPCGAKVVATERADVTGYVIATFRLTERPGPGSCGTGTGNRARTAFRVRDGKIVEWVRVADPPGQPDAAGSES